MTYGVKPGLPMTRHQVETRTVAILRKALSHGRKGAVVITTTRAGFYRQMDVFGLDGMAAYRAFQDCYDMAELENLAQAP